MGLRSSTNLGEVDIQGLPAYDEPMFTFLVFAGHQYYPEAGFRDLRDSWQSEDEARTSANAHAQHYDWVKIINYDPLTGDYREIF